MGHTYRGGKSGGELLTLFGGYSYDGVSAGIWVIHTEVANLGVTLFGGFSYDGVSLGIWVTHTEVANMGVVSDTFWRLLL